MAGGAGVGGGAGGSGDYRVGPGGPGDGLGDPAWPSGPPSLRARRSVVPALSVAAAAAVILAVAGVYYYLRNPSPAQAAGNKSHEHPAAALAAKGPEQVLSVTPADGATRVNGGGKVRVVFSEPLSASSAMPSLTPAIRGTWQRSGSTAT